MSSLRQVTSQMIVPFLSKIVSLDNFGRGKSCFDMCPEQASNLGLRQPLYLNLSDDLTLRPPWLVGRSVYFELKDILTDSIVLNTGIKY